MDLLCIDPGTTHSGVVVYNGNDVLSARSDVENAVLIGLVSDGIYSTCDHMAVEMVASYGMAVGREVFETCVWIGRFIERFHGPAAMVYRRDVKLHLCGSPRAKDGNIRQAILDRFPATGGGKTPQIGTQKQPGPLYGVKSHAFPALAVGITFFETMR